MVIVRTSKFNAAFETATLLNICSKLTKFFLFYLKVKLNSLKRHKSSGNQSKDFRKRAFKLSFFKKWVNFDRYLYVYILKDL